MADGPDAGLGLVRALAASPVLQSTSAVAAAEADIFRRAGRRTEAAEAYRRAIDAAATDAEQRFLQRRLEALEALDSHDGVAPELLALPAPDAVGHPGQH